MEDTMAGDMDMEDMVTDMGTVIITMDTAATMITITMTTITGGQLQMSMARACLSPQHLQVLTRDSLSQYLDSWVTTTITTPATMDTATTTGDSVCSLWPTIACSLKACCCSLCLFNIRITEIK